MGVITFAFGMGGTLANFAGLMHMVLHSLTKSAIFFCVGHIAQVKGTQRMADIRGLTVSHPVLGWSLVVGVVVDTSGSIGQKMLNMFGGHMAAIMDDARPEDELRFDAIAIYRTDEGELHVDHIENAWQP